MSKAHYSMSIYQKKFKCIKNKRLDNEIDITSLLDVLVILLFFLVLNYNPTDLEISPVSNVKIPLSLNREYGNRAVLIQISKDKDFYIGSVFAGSLLSEEGRLSIKDKLQSAYKIQAEQFSKMNQEMTKTHHMGNMNIMFDEELAFDSMNDVMRLAAANGFQHFKLIVMPGKTHE